MRQYDFLATDFNESKVMHATHAHLCLKIVVILQARLPEQKGWMRLSEPLPYLQKLTHDLNENLLKLGKLGVLT